MDLSKFDFHLPDELIARYPAKNRDESRLLVLNKQTKSIVFENVFKNIENFLLPNDILVYNQTRVSKRRVFLQNKSGREFECIFLEKILDLGNEKWKVLIKNVRKLKLGETLFTKDENIYFTLNRNEVGDIFLYPSIPISEDVFEKIGTIPIPPYLKRKAEESDKERYQTIFASTPGSVAAPTAGLHFTEELKFNLQKKGITFTEVELCIGYGTFSPLTVEQIQEKKLHEEEFYIPETTLNLLNEAKGKRRIIAIGTTSLRTLESSYDRATGKYVKTSGITNIFIQPGDSVDSIEGLITNFHLPESSLLLLVAAFAGTEFILEAYHKAIENKMRFYSYGDAMLIL
ncbi:MAG: tRNA preQ1(34) S-adenosylmethionine ribosyltransferase-isomerase QueA [Leptospiraceae bacterium]|nr:tRNA preQ1(34) S-adenosylmethionine ribosyltransferase-isomerase QueA [Leptospiraceae bacterium]